MKLLVSVRNFRTLGFSALMIVVACMAAMATDPTPPDYSAAATAFKDGLTPILTTVLPIAVAGMAIWFGPHLFKRLVKSFIH